MIKIDISTAIAAYLVFSVIVVLVIWMTYEHSWKIKKYSSDKQVIWQCVICFYTYVDSTHQTYSTCPQCGSYNERKGSQETQKDDAKIQLNKEKEVMG